MAQDQRLLPRECREAVSTQPVKGHGASIKQTQILGQALRLSECKASGMSKAHTFLNRTTKGPKGHSDLLGVSIKSYCAMRWCACQEVQCFKHGLDGFHPLLQGLTYKAPMSVDLCYQLDNMPIQRLSKRMGSIPIMVKSRLCHLRHMSRAQLVTAKEESTEMGGYFICNGIERIIRMLIQQRRHYIMALRRGAYKKRGSNYTEAATMLR